MIKNSIFLLIFLIIPLSGFAADDENGQNCYDNIRDSLSTDQEISILKKDNQKVYGYFKGVQSDSMLVASLDYEPKLLGVELNQISWVSYDQRVGGFDRHRAGGFFILGMVLGGAAGYVIDNNRTPSGDENSSFDPLLVLGSSLVGGIISYLGYRVSSEGKTERVYIRCE